MKALPAADKLRGGYYTPQAIARFLSEWGIRDGRDHVLEPACGDGNILIEALRRLQELKSSKPCVHAIELDHTEAGKARARAKLVTKTAQPVSERDFFEFANIAFRDETKFDVVVGNPPFIRYQDFPEAQRLLAFGLMRTLGLAPSRLANSWLPFLVICSALLNDKGRLAMVIPAELFQVGYAAETRRFLATHFEQLDIVAFNQLVFPDIQQEVVLLLAERRSADSKHGIRVHEVGRAEDLSSLDLNSLKSRPIKPIDHSSEKWTKYFLSVSEIELLRTLRGRADIPSLDRYIDIDVGVVTGDNDYFVLHDDDVERNAIDGDTTPLVGRSAALPGIMFNRSDLKRWQTNGGRTNLFFPKRPYGAAVKRYIKKGETAGVHKGYKCRIRDEWFVVPSVWTPDFFFMRQADTAPRMVANHTGATCTDTLHRGRLTDGVGKDTLSAVFLNSLTIAASEVTGRSYGGGVMTYEPSEVERLPLPADGGGSLDVPEVDRLVRNKKLEEALDLVDREVLNNHLGLSQKDVKALRGIWVKLRDRRRGRKHRVSKK